MCGRITLSSPASEIIEEFSLSAVPAEFRPRFNIAPSQPVLGIVAGEGGSPEAGYFRWGLVPFWAKDISIGNRMINARAETVAAKPAFRNALTRRRCLIPVDGFYEWKRLETGKVPIRIRMHSGRPFALAGLWEEWRPKHGAPLRSCTILTTGCSEFMRPIHDRMPVILPRATRSRWLDPATDPGDLQDMLVSYDADDLEAYEVSTLVNSPAHDVAECLDPV